ncbi:DUF2815 family protein [Halobacillus shinanisalinarum]|uniref:DUF2815 family protein n=1 Tax=Halobacillus shinanisalinarum TaxID=2932258 RepID=A0ABY4GZP2_9BACI|nr:DUF2815 family protein [Halobacillus shinanisalinarum]UOQ93390.1 DUF2815 family protein [Halobacillus shinanisalinarum]
MAKLNETKVVTNEARFSYTHVFEPHAIEGNDPKYSVAILIPKKDKETIECVEKAIEAAKQAGKSSKFSGKIPPTLKTPLRDGDEERPDDEAYQGHYFMNATSKTKPGLVKKGSAGLLEITDEAELYSGCYGKASVNFFPFNSNGNKGVACGLNNLLKTNDGEALAGKPNATDDFADELDGDDDDDDFLG